MKKTDLPSGFHNYLYGIFLGRIHLYFLVGIRRLGWSLWGLLGFNTRLLLFGHIELHLPRAKSSFIILVYPPIFYLYIRCISGHLSISRCFILKILPIPVLWCLGYLPGTKALWVIKDLFHFTLLRPFGAFGNKFVPPHFPFLNLGPWTGLFHQGPFFNRKFLPGFYISRVFAPPFSLNPLRPFSLRTLF